MTKTHQTDILGVLQRSPSKTSDIKKAIVSNNEDEEGWKNWTKKDKRFRKAMNNLVATGKAVQVGGKYRLPTATEKKKFSLEKHRASVRARLASGESQEIAGGGLGAGDLSTSNWRSGRHMVAVMQGGPMECTRVLLRLLAQHTNMGYTSHDMHRLDAEALKEMANHPDTSVASVILKRRFFTVTGIDETTFQQVFLEWSNTKVDKTEKRRLQSLPDVLKKYKLAVAIETVKCAH